MRIQDDIGSIEKARKKTNKINKQKGFDLEALIEQVDPLLTKDVL